ncbi:MAG TPA: GNAT family N-acetyltransferase, partial [Candidatus Nanoarchaeia archaeon]|nr:GNAT family N-acetyltransferase [Candidatus Nanoarchaeia archaeon]
NLGLGTEMVDYTLDLATQMGVENVYAIMLPDNYRALSLTKKMGFDIEYLSDGTVKGTLSLKEELSEQCVLLNKEEMIQPEHLATPKTKQSEPTKVPPEASVREPVQPKQLTPA